jgi:nucleotide-binding universal stress UspA family protein
LFAEYFDAEIHLLNVVPHVIENETIKRKLKGWNLIEVIEDTEVSLRDLVIKDAEVSLKDFQSRYNSIIPRCKSSVINGIVDREILRYVALQGIDLVVIGTHGRRPPEEIGFGSVAHRIVRKCTVPVVTVNPYKY